MKLTRKLEIGMNAVNVLRSKNGPTKCADMKDEVGTTVHFLEQVMRKLREGGIVSVKRGPGGGYILNKDATVNAMQVANSLGEKLGDLVLDDVTPTGRLKTAVVNAFLNTSV